MAPCQAGLQRDLQVPQHFLHVVAVPPAPNDLCPGMHRHRSGDGLSRLLAPEVQDCLQDTSLRTGYPQLYTGAIPAVPRMISHRDITPSYL